MFHTLWSTIMAAWPYSPRLLFTAGMMITHEVVFWGLCAILSLSHSLLAPYRIQPNRYPSQRLISSTIRKLLILHFLVQPVQLYLLYPLFEYMGMSSSVQDLPTLPTLLLQLALCFAINETGFYWSHRALHSDALFKKFHSQHHMYGAPIGIAAEHASSLESLISNGLPTIAGPLLLGTHMLTAWIWLALRLALTVDNHCGYALPFSPFHWGAASKINVFASHPLAHNFHHSHNDGLYGGNSFFWDWLCGTDAAFNTYLDHRSKHTEKEL